MPNNKKNILIAQAEPPLSGGGDYYYRTHAPGLAMSNIEGVYVINFTNEHRKKFEIMEQADVLILKNICDPDLFPVIRKRKSDKKLTVYEIADDLTAIPEWNPVYFFYKNPENQALFQRLAHLCDIVQVTCKELKRIYSYLNDSIYVLPNQISVVPTVKEKKYDGEIIIGWGGSHGHLEDIKNIADSLIDFVISRPDVKLHLMCSEPIWHLFDEIPSTKKKHFKTGSIDEYYSFINGLHIGLAPLRNSAFNRSRSDVKFIEYAVSGVVPVVGDLEPYKESVIHGETGFLFNNGNELKNILETIIENPILLSEISVKSRQYILNNRLENDHAGKRISIYKDRLADLSGKENSESKALEQFRTLSILDGAVTTGRHIKLNPGNYEIMIQQGLSTMQFEENRDEALQYFNEASLIEPLNYLPFLYGSALLADPINVLIKALELRPDSIKSWLILGDFFAKQGKAMEAIQSFENALKIHPDYELPYLKAGNLLKQMGDEEQSVMLMEKAEMLQEDISPYRKHKLDPKVRNFSL